jgi:hypothetical protein
MGFSKVKKLIPLKNYPSNLSFVIQMKAFYQLEEKLV